METPRNISYFYNRVRDGRSCKTTTLKDYPMVLGATRLVTLLNQNVLYKDMHKCTGDP